MIKYRSSRFFRAICACFFYDLDVHTRVSGRASNSLTLREYCALINDNDKESPSAAVKDMIGRLMSEADDETTTDERLQQVAVTRRGKKK